MKNWIQSQIQDPVKWRRLNGWLVIFWAFMFPVSIIFHLATIVAFISYLSLYANFATHLGVWAGARAEAKVVDVQETSQVNIDKANEVKFNSESQQ